MKKAYTKDKNRNFEYIVKNIKCSFMSRLSFEFYLNFLLFMYCLEAGIQLIPNVCSKQWNTNNLYLTLK